MQVLIKIYINFISNAESFNFQRTCDATLYFKHKKFDIMQNEKREITATKNGYKAKVWASALKFFYISSEFNSY